MSSCVILMHSIAMTLSGGQLRTKWSQSHFCHPDEATLEFWHCSQTRSLVLGFKSFALKFINSDGILVESRACVCSLYHNIVTYSLLIPNPFLWDALQQCGVPCLYYIYLSTSFDVPSFNFEPPLVTPHILFHLCSSQSSLYLNHYAQSNFRRKNNFRSYFLKSISCLSSKWWGR